MRGPANLIKSFMVKWAHVDKPCTGGLEALYLVLFVGAVTCKQKSFSTTQNGSHFSRRRLKLSMRLFVGLWGLNCIVTSGRLFTKLAYIVVLVGLMRSCGNFIWTVVDS